jgi:hypothetical protein
VNDGGPARWRGLIDDGLPDPGSREGRAQLEALAEWAALSSRAERPAGARRDVVPVRLRLLATLGGVERFAPFFDELRALVGLDLPALERELAKIDWTSDGPPESSSASDAAAGWQRAPFPGVRYLDFTPGPAAGVAEAGLVRVAAGGHFPRHVHVARERACVLEGIVILEGRTHHPGTIIDSPAGSRHEFWAGPQRDLVLMVAHGGIHFGPGGAG